MTAVLGTVVCPVCGQVVKESPTRVVMFAHSDGVGRACGMSGQPFGGIVQGARILELDEVFW